MKVTIKNKTSKFEVENWKERFVIRISNLLVQEKKEGLALPYFYLPVWRNNNEYSLECWILPLAPLVLAWKIISQITWMIWKDLVDWQRMLYEYRKPSTPTEDKTPKKQLEQKDEDK